MNRFYLLILICSILWIFWMSWEWLRNRKKTSSLSNSEKEKQQQNNTENEKTSNS